MVTAMPLGGRVDDNGIPRRVRELEMTLASHIAEYREHKTRMQDHFNQNAREHAQMKKNLDNIDNSLGTVTMKVAAIVGGATAAGSLIAWWLNSGG